MGIFSPGFEEEISSHLPHSDMLPQFFLNVCVCVRVYIKTVLLCHCLLPWLLSCIYDVSHLNLSAGTTYSD